jgi:hypothetical protein
MSEPSDTPDQDARAAAPKAQKRGTALEIALEAVARLGAMRRPRSRVLHRRRMPPTACSRAPDEEES